jgi:hypothetical protein
MQECADQNMVLQQRNHANWSGSESAEVNFGAEKSPAQAFENIKLCNSQTQSR